jgi:acyl phosphate:glycerol-3-phosphate acyltransferase
VINMSGSLATLIAYLLGSIPFGYLIVRWQRGIDVRQTGSGSIGATNVMRNLGIAGFVATFALDCGKGLAAVMVASRLTGNDARWVAAAAVAAVAGHLFPVWLGFRGGKGVATGVGVFAAVAPIPMALALVFFAVLVGIWRYISLGSIVATASFPVLVYLVNKPPTPIVIGAACAAALIIVSHRANIRRLLTRTEKKLGEKS